MSKAHPSFGQSATTSVSSTPAPPALSETLSLHTLPRPFKQPSFTARMARISSNLSRRNKSLKQILQSEREPALRASGVKMREKKTPAARSSELIKGRLTGAAKKAWVRREEREKKEREERGEAEIDKKEDESKEENHEEHEEQVKLYGEVDEQPQRPKRDVPTYATVEAPPSFRPQKKYCDVTGLIAPYTDPKSRLRYHSVEVYDIIKQFGPGVDNAYLALRGDASEIK